jgi:hypothetical protein
MQDVLLGSTLEELFIAACTYEESDIYLHLPTLRSLASTCRHVTEFGMRGSTGSTIAFLAGKPETFVSWDTNPYMIVSQNTMNLLYLSEKTNYQPRVGDSTKVDIEPTDLLFFDTVHTSEHLAKELERHCFVPHCKVRKFLVFHDVETYGNRGGDGKEPGILGAISWFYRNNFPLWRPVHFTQRNNGLLVLQREVDWEQNPWNP